MRLPLTVIGGYLGAGKTTLINRLLTEDHGQRLLVMVNDFGAINIDASLIVGAEGGTVTLSNGCVCCTMGADLFMAVGDVLDQPRRPDHIVIEASGIANPARIAEVAKAEPDLCYGGVVVVVDAAAYDGLAGDPQIGPQIREQTAVADLRLVSKSQTGCWPETLVDGAHDLQDLETVAPLILGLRPDDVPGSTGAHSAYLSWSCVPDAMSRAALEAKLATRPSDVLRLKGFVPHENGLWEVHVVGQACSIRPAVQDATPGLVAIGLASRIAREDIAAWWDGS